MTPFTNIPKQIEEALENCSADDVRAGASSRAQVCWS